MAIRIKNLEDTLVECVRHVCNMKGRLLRENTISVDVESISVQVSVVAEENSLAVQSIQFQPVRKSTNISTQEADGTVALATERSDNTTANQDSAQESNVQTYGRQTIGETTYPGT